MFESNMSFVWNSFGILGLVWYLIVSIPDLCTLTYLCKADVFLFVIAGTRLI